MEKLEACQSYYMPSFFRIKVGVYDDFTDMLSIPYGAYSLFFHEYIHFIQDVTTIYGLMNLHTITYYIQDVASRVGKDPNPEFKIPQKLEYRHGDYGVDNFELRPVYMGSPINPKHKKIRIIDYQKIPYSKGSKFLTDIIEVNYEDLLTGETCTFKLGGNQVCESMAYLCESYVYKPVFEKNSYIYSDADDYPYNVCKLLAEKIYPEFSQNDILLVAACDISLMTYHPGLSFVRLLEHLKKTDFLSGNFSKITEVIQALYTDGLAFLKGSHVDFATIQNIVRDNVKKNFKCAEFEGNNKWIDTLFERANTFRTEVPQFITDVLLFGQGKDVRENQFFGYLLGFLGSPLIVNEENFGAISLPIHFYDSTFMPGLFWAINQVLRVFADNKALPCELKEHCKRSAVKDPEIKVDDRCDTAPWSRCYDKRLCPFAVIWRHWNLGGHIPVK